MRSRIQSWATRIVLLVPLAAFLYSPSAALAGALASANGFLLLDASTVADADSTVITRDLGLSPGPVVTGLDPVALAGTAYRSAGTPAAARVDATTAYRSSALLPFASDLTGQDLGGLTWTPALYRIDTSVRLTGTLTFSGPSNANDAISVVQIGAAVRPSGGSAIKRFSGENNRMSWQVGTSAAGDPGTEPDPALVGDVPEPGTVSLFCLGLLTLTLYGWQTRKRLV